MSELFEADRAVDPARRLRLIATGLLGVMVVVYAVARANSDAGPVWGYVRAFAEAAMIGGLADWFAVTAIFKRPFGLPIPHTAVIPNQKDRIADSIGAFIAENFLSPELVTQRLSRSDPTRALADRMADPRQAEAIADGVARAAPALLGVFDEEAVAAFVRRQARLTQPGAALAPAAGMALEAFAAQGRHHQLIDAGLTEAWKWLSANQGALRARVSENTGWLWRVIKVDARAADAMVKALEDSIVEAARDPEHPLRQHARAWIVRLADELRTTPAAQARVQAFVEDVLEQPATGAALRDFWRAAADAIRADCASPNSRLRGAVAELIQRLGEGMREDAALRAAVNQRLTTLAADLAARHGRDAATMVAETIRSWDAKTVTAKLEQGLGRDLQFIRLNGTIIGGLIGLGLHAAFEAFAKL